MARQTARREELVEGATDYVLEHGLIGLSLRPMAAALGTSDRMLLYHFADKDDLVSSVLRASNDRSVRHLRSLPPSARVAEAVPDLWRAVTSPELDRCQRMYVEAAALGLLGSEPYAGVVREANQTWVRTVADHLAGSGVPRERAVRAAVLVDATFMGFQLDMALDDEPTTIEDAVRDLSDALVVLAGAQGSA